MSTGNLKIFSARLKARRLERGKTIQQVADAAGVSLGAAAYWEHEGNFPKHNALKRVAEFLETTIEHLRGEDASESAVALVAMFRDDCRKHFEQAMQSQDAAKLGWLLTELREKFPIKTDDDAVVSGTVGGVVEAVKADVKQTPANASQSPQIAPLPSVSGNLSDPQT